MQLAALAHRLDAAHPAAAAQLEEVRAMQEITEDAMIRLHELATSLRPISLDKLGLADALDQYVVQFSRQHGLEITTELSALVGLRLPPALETALYRIVQECLLNAVQHGQPRVLSVLFVKRKDHLVAIIEDDGAGQDGNSAAPTDGLGLLAVRERVETLGGTIIVESPRGRGTTVLIDVPRPLTP
jgi:signal transduction histidine kinase